MEAIVELWELKKISKSLSLALDNIEKGSRDLILRHLYDVKQSIDEIIEDCIDGFED